MPRGVHGGLGQQVVLQANQLFDLVGFDEARQLDTPILFEEGKGPRIPAETIDGQQTQ